MEVGEYWNIWNIGNKYGKWGNVTAIVANQEKEFRVRVNRSPVHLPSAAALRH